MSVPPVGVNLPHIVSVRATMTLQDTDRPRGGSIGMEPVRGVSEPSRNQVGALCPDVFG